MTREEKVRPIMTREEAVRLIEAAAGPADLFHGEATRAYRKLARLTHPDTGAEDGRTERAFARLAVLWQQHRGGSRPRLAAGDIAGLYQVADGVLKLPRDPADNDLMDAESSALTRLRAVGEARLCAYFPRLIGTERQRDPATGALRHATILGSLDGFVTLADVRRAYPDGLDPRDAAWIWRRLLVALGAAHRAGILHGAVLPPHVMIHPAKHGLVLVDWCYSVSRRGGPIPAIVERYRGWYPPEVLAKGAPAAGTDIYLATRCMTDLMAGAAPRQLSAFANGCALPRCSRRPQDAWRLLGELDVVLDRLYGPRRFRPFAMPG
jgi:hypothetical protein